MKFCAMVGHNPDSSRLDFDGIIGFHVPGIYFKGNLPLM